MPIEDIPMGLQPSTFRVGKLEYIASIDFVSGKHYIEENDKYSQNWVCKSFLAMGGGAETLTNTQLDTRIILY